VSELILSVNDTNLSGWKSVDCTLSMETLAGNFNVSVSDVIGQDVKIKPGDACSVKIEGTPVITGFVDQVSLSLSKDMHTVSISGRDKTGDLVDCSAFDITVFQDLAVDQIIKRLCAPFQIPVQVIGDAGAKIQSYVLEQGSTIFEAIQKLAYYRQFLVLSDNKGGLLLTQAGTGHANTQLIEGQNLLSVNADYNISQRFSNYTVKSQLTGTDEDTTYTAVKGEAEDKVIKRYRPLLVMAESAATQGECKKRAEWEAAIRRGKSKTFTASVAGWINDAGEVWTCNQVVSLKSPTLAIDEVLLIAELNFKLDESGTTTTLKLVPPESYSLDPSSVLLKTNKFLDTK
jgi:prophage tail gpP-like protein